MGDEELTAGPPRDSQGYPLMAPALVTELAEATSVVERLTAELAECRERWNERTMAARRIKVSAEPSEQLAAAEAALVVARTERDEAREKAERKEGDFLKMLGASAVEYKRAETAEARVGELTTALTDTALWFEGVGGVAARAERHVIECSDAALLGWANVLRRVLAGGDDREGYRATILQAYEDGSGLAGGGAAELIGTDAGATTGAAWTDGDTVVQSLGDVLPGEFTDPQSPGTPSGGER